MTTIINNVHFDTTNATAVAEYTNDLNRDDDFYTKEVLYRKNDGTYFMLGEGGCFSDYGYMYDETIGYGREIYPMSLDEAKNWAERYMTVSAYEKEFGPIPRNASQVNVCVTISSEAYDAVINFANSNSQDIHCTVDALLRKALNL